MGFIMPMNFFEKSRYIAESLYRFCVVPDDGKRLRETGSVSPSSTLKCRAAKAAFEWASSVPHKKKYFTLAACREAIQLLAKKPDVHIPQVVGLPLELWLEQQAKIVLHLCQRSRKNSGSALRFQSYRQSCSMDWVETVPYEARFRHERNAGKPPP